MVICSSTVPFFKFRYVIHKCEIKSARGRAVIDIGHTTSTKCKWTNDDFRLFNPIHTISIVDGVCLTVLRFTTTLTGQLVTACKRIQLNKLDKYSGSIIHANGAVDGSLSEEIYLANDNIYITRKPIRSLENIRFQFPSKLYEDMKTNFDAKIKSLVLFWNSL